MSLGFKCSCGWSAVIEENGDRNSVRFGAVRMHCEKCRKTTGDHLGFSFQQNLDLAIEEWEKINVSTQAASNEVH